MWVIEWSPSHVHGLGSVPSISKKEKKNLQIISGSCLLFSHQGNWGVLVDCSEHIRFLSEAKGLLPIWWRRIDRPNHVKPSALGWSRWHREEPVPLPRWSGHCLTSARLLSSLTCLFSWVPSHCPRTSTHFIVLLLRADTVDWGCEDE